MSHINWYPGHMHKASKELRKTIPDMDVIIEVLDARIPFSSNNPLLAQLRGDKPCIKILNKCDLADPAMTAQWQAYLEQQTHTKTLALTIMQPDRMTQILSLCHTLLPAKAAKGQRIEALIMGIPNVGKSTLINHLAGRIIAKTGNEPAVTKHQQRIKLDRNVLLLDTPGMLWPKLENQHSAYRLAVTGAIKETAISNEDIALYAVGYFRQAYPDILKQRYQLDHLPENDEILLAEIGRRRGCLRRGNEVALERAAKIVLTEFRDGTIGRMTLETPDMMVQEMEEVERRRAEQQAKKEARQKRRQSKK